MGCRSLCGSSSSLRVSGPFPFAAPSPTCSLPLPSYSPTSIRGLALAAAVVALQEKEAIEPAPPSQGYYSWLFVTPRVTGGWRTVIDLSCLNSWVDVSHFHMETAQSVLQSLRPGDWMVSLDLQVPVHPSSQRFLRFCVGESVFQFRALCFGLSTAPQAFTHVMVPVSSIMHRHGFRILRYLDDWLVLGSSFREIVRVRDFLLWLCQQLGIQINLPKRSLTPTQSIDYLGMKIQTVPLRGVPTLKRIQKLSYLVQAFLSDRLHPLSVWCQLLGVMSSLSAMVLTAHLHMYSLQLRLHVARSRLLDEDLVSWDDSCLPDLR